MVDDNKKWLYDKLSGKGVNVGTYDQFNKAIADEKNLKWAYDKAGQKGLNVGEYDAFLKAMGYTPVETPADASESPAKTGQELFNEMREAHKPEVSVIEDAPSDVPETPVKEEATPAPEKKSDYRFSTKSTVKGKNDTPYEPLNLAYKGEFQPEKGENVPVPEAPANAEQMAADYETQRTIAKYAPGRQDDKTVPVENLSREQILQNAAEGKGYSIESAVQIGQQMEALVPVMTEFDSKMKDIEGKYGDFLKSLKKDKNGALILSTREEGAKYDEYAKEITPYMEAAKAYENILKTPAGQEFLVLQDEMQSVLNEPATAERNVDLAKLESMIGRNPVYRAFMGENAPTESQLRFNEIRAEQAYYTELRDKSNNRRSNTSFAPRTVQEYEQMVADEKEKLARDDYKQILDALRVELNDNRYFRESLTKSDVNINAELENVGAKMAELEAKYAPEGTVGGAVAEAAKNALQSNPEYQRYQIAQNSLLRAKMQLKHLREGKADSFSANMLEVFADPNFFSFGLYGLGSAIAARCAYNDPESLGREELLSAIVGQKEIEELKGDFTTWVGRAGQITANMIPFMASIALTGGFGGVAKATERGIGNLVTKYASKEAAENLAVRAFGAILGDLAAGAVSANTVGLGTTASDILNRYYGRLVRDENGEYRYENGQSLGMAIYGGEISNILEYSTERFGDHVQRAIGKGILRLGKGKSWENLAEILGSSHGVGWKDIGYSKIAEKGLQTTFEKIFKHSSEVLGKLGVQGYPYEVMEEEVNILGNILFRTGDNSFKDFRIDSDTQADIWGGMLFSMGAMQGIALVTSAGAEGINALRRNKSYKRIEGNLQAISTYGSRLLGEDRWAEIQKRVDNASNKDIPAIINDVVSSKNYSPLELDAIRSYIGNTYAYRGFNGATLALAEDASNRLKSEEPLTSMNRNSTVSYAETEIAAAYMLGYNSGMEQKEIEDALANQKERVKTVFGMDDMTFEQALGAINKPGATADEVDTALDYAMALAAQNGMEDLGKAEHRAVRSGVEAEIHLRYGNRIDRPSPDGSGRIVEQTFMERNGKPFPIYIVSAQPLSNGQMPFRAPGVVGTISREQVYTLDENGNKVVGQTQILDYDQFLDDYAHQEEVERKRQAEAARQQVEAAETQQKVDPQPAPDMVKEAENLIGDDRNIVYQGIPMEVHVSEVNGAANTVSFTYQSPEGPQLGELTIPAFFDALNAKVEQPVVEEAPVTEEVVDDLPEDTAVVENAPQPSPAPVKEEVVIPVDEKSGEPIYDAPGITPQQALDAVYKDFGNDEDAEGYIIEQAKKTAKALEKAKKAKEDADAEKAEIEKWRRKDGEGPNALAKRKDEAWKAVDKKTADKIAQIPELERRLILWDALRDVVERRQRLRNKKESLDLSAGDIREKIAAAITEMFRSRKKISLPSLAVVVGKNVAQDVYEKFKHSGIFSVDGKNSATLDEIVHGMVFTNLEDKISSMDEQDAVNEMADMLVNMTRKEIRDYTKNNREQEAKEADQYNTDPIEEATQGKFKYGEWVSFDIRGQKAYGRLESIDTANYQNVVLTDGRGTMRSVPISDIHKPTLEEKKALEERAAMLEAEQKAELENQPERESAWEPEVSDEGIPTDEKGNPLFSENEKAEGTEVPYTAEEQPLVDRVNEWTDRTGVPVVICRNIDEVKSKSAKAAIKAGRRITGWYEDGKVYVYLPNNIDPREIDKTFIHEVVSHKGLRQLLREEGYAALCDKVWNEMMTQNQRDRYMFYNRHLEGLTEEELHRAAADEFMAVVSERLDIEKNRNIFRRIVDAIREFLERRELEGKKTIKLDMTIEDLESLLRSSLQNFEKNRAKEKLDVDKAGNTFFREKGNLVGLHNISEYKLLQAMKAGGLANPSAAIIDINKGEHSKFGEISLVMSPELVAASTGRNAGTYLGDAWTATFPSTKKIMGKEGDKKYWQEIESLPREVRYDIANAFDNYLDSDRDGDWLRWWFLSDKGKNPEIIHYESPYSEEDARAIEGMDSSNLSKEDIKKLIDLYRKYESEESFNKATSRFEPKEDASEFVKRRMAEYNKDVDEYGIHLYAVESFIDKAKDLIRKDGQLNNYATMDEARKAVNDGGLDNEFHTWLQGKEEQFDAQVKLFAGRDSQGRARWMDNTAENASKIMNREKNQNAYDDNGLSAVRASMAKVMRTLGQIHANEDKLVSREEYDKEYDRVQQMYTEAISELDGMQKISDNPFSNYDYAASRLAEALTESNPAGYLNREYGYSITEDGDYAKSLLQLKENIMDMPATYFETKFNRPVGLNEFSAAVVPNTLNEGTKKLIEDAGLKVYEYDSTDDGVVARKEAVLKATEETNTRFREAPNGNQSNLDVEQWEQVRTPAFRAWFGDWEKDPQNASKVVDENGEPLVVYRGAKFDPLAKEAGEGVIKPMAYFSPSKEYSDRYYNDDGATRAYYLNIRHPFDIRNKKDRAVLRSMLPDWYELPETNSGALDWAIFATAIDIDEFMENHPEYDGAVLDEGADPDGKGGFIERGLSYVPFEGGAQVKSAEENNGEFSPNNNDVRFREANAHEEMFFSNAERAVENIPMERATPQQWLKMIEGKGGLKAGEDKWIGLSDWLKASNKKTLNKDEVLDYINKNKILIEETHYVDYEDIKTLKALQDEFETIPFDDNEALWQDADRRLAEFYEEMQSKYGDGYLEELSQNEWMVEKRLLDERESYEGEQDPYEAAFNAMVEKYGDDFGIAFGHDNGKLYISNPEAAEYYLGERAIDDVRMKYTTDGLENKREIALSVPTIEPWNENDDIHFGDAGEGRAIAWARFGDTFDPELGGSVLFIDEIQSKRHQEGRERGYQEESSAQLSREWQEAINRYKLLSEEAMDSDRPKPATEQEWENVREARREMDAARVAYNNNARKIPQAPFEKNWHELAMKRMLRLAADEGYDFVAWTTGDQQAERYSLSTVINGIETVQNHDGSGRREVFLLQDGAPDIQLTVDAEGEVKWAGRYHQAFVGQKLADIIGKELAVKTMATETDEAGNAEVVAEGQDLKVGGEGMRGFYDDMLVRSVNKYAKKWGVSVIDEPVTLNDGAMLEAHVLPVTEEMKESIKEGQPMFREAYHGSRADFDRFDSSHMGEGEGAQAHGWGHYVALNEGTANRYAYKLFNEDERLGATAEAVERLTSDISKVKDDYMREHYKKELEDLENARTLASHYRKMEQDAYDRWSEAIQPYKDKLDRGEINRAQYWEQISADENASELQKQYADLYEQANDKEDEAGHLRRQLREIRDDLQIDTEEFKNLQAERDRLLALRGLYELPVRPKNFDAENASAKEIKTYSDAAEYIANRGWDEAKDMRGEGWYDYLDDERKAAVDLIASTKRDDWHFARNLYTVEIPDDTGENYLDEDEKVPERTLERVREGLTEQRKTDDFLDLRIPDFDTVKDMLADMNDKFFLPKSGVDGRNLYGYLKNVFGSKEGASKFLHSVGFAGIKYDGRVDGPCAVIFSDDDIQITGHTRFRDSGLTGVASADYEYDMKKAGVTMRIEHQDSQLPARFGMERVAKEKGIDLKDIPDNENYLMRQNLSSSRADVEAQEYQLYYFTPLIEQVREVQKALMGKSRSKKMRVQSYEDILDYMYAMSAIERNRYKNAEVEKERQDALKRYKDPKAIAVINAKYDAKLRDWSGLTSLVGLSAKEWRLAEVKAQKMIDAFKKRLGSNADALLDELWNRVRNCTDFSLDHARRYGLITKQTYDLLHGTDTTPRMWEYYLPLRGFKEQTAEDEYGYSTFANRDSGNTVVKQANGRWTEADNPLANILNIAENEIVQGNNNWAKQALYRFTLAMGKNSLLSIREPWYEKVNGGWMLAQPLATDPATGKPETLEDFERRMVAKMANGEAMKWENGLKLDKILANKAHRNEHLIKLKDGGRDVMIWVNGNPAFAKAVMGSGRPASATWNGIRNVSRKLSNLFTTYSLDFTIRNLFRDTFYSRMAIHMKEDREYRWIFRKHWYANWAGGAFVLPLYRLIKDFESGKLQQKANPTKKEQSFIDFMRNGGATGYTIINSVSDIKKELDAFIADAGRGRAALKKFAMIYPNFVKAMNEGFELLTRFTAYQASIDYGRSPERAASDAKEISVNFNRRGAQSGEGFWGWTAQYLGATHYFYNAGVQGFQNYMRLWHLKPWQMGADTAMIAAMGMFAPVINALLAGLASGDGDDDDKNADWYWNLPEWTRRNNLVIGVPGDKYIALPLPVELRAAYGLGDIAASFMFQKKTMTNGMDIALDVLDTAGGLLPVNPIEGYSGSSSDGKTVAGRVIEGVFRAGAPDATMFLVDYVTNRDYTGRPLAKVNPFNKKNPRSQGAYASTPKAIVDACQWLAEHTAATPFFTDTAPGVVRDFGRSYGGGFYRLAEDLMQAVYNDPEHPWRWDNIPFASGVSGRIDKDRKDSFARSTLYDYEENMQNVLVKLNAAARTKDITAKQAFAEPETLPDKAKTQIIYEGKKYELAKMYYDGMHDGVPNPYKYHYELKTPKSGKNKGVPSLRKVNDKDPGVETLKKRYNELFEQYTKEQDGEKKKAMEAPLQEAMNKWHDAEGNLADDLLNMEYNGTPTEDGWDIEEKGETLSEKAYNTGKEIRK